MNEDWRKRRPATITLAALQSENFVRFTERNFKQSTEKYTTQQQERGLCEKTSVDRDQSLVEFTKLSGINLETKNSRFNLNK